ncbi:hypothetical protein K469DRAFT_726948 [Zopfia rhizophila CBS 207.26]|uniref:Uncharacterized protein n=1 Tax=Zopfia rhizophila CBS 207.26 TaxID=1314779 RepID=A0A6A6E3A3_9PEZI|nr:hypothetical protein K469DRAFT_726948 [Zopfia rhizophila CBS 207.26]
MAGDLWLLLIQYASKFRRGEEVLSKVRGRENRYVMEDFLDSADRLWARLNKLIKKCEAYMWKQAKRRGRDKDGNLKMGKNAGCDFVDALLQSDLEHEATEKLMQGLSL